MCNVSGNVIQCGSFIHSSGATTVAGAIEIVDDGTATDTWSIHLEISNNVISWDDVAADQAIDYAALYGVLITGFDTARIKSVKIDGNHLYGCGIRTFEGIDTLVVSNNIMKKPNRKGFSYGGTFKAGIGVHRIFGNTIEEARAEGISVLGGDTTTQLYIENNISINNRQGTTVSTSLNSLRLDSIDLAVVRNNVFGDSQDIPTQTRSWQVTNTNVLVNEGNVVLGNLLNSLSPTAGDDSYAGDPNGNVIPGMLGQELIDTTNDKWYKAIRLKVCSSSDTQFDVTNPAGTTHRYTYDTNGTDPVIGSAYVKVGDTVTIAAGTTGSFAAGNAGTFTITAVGSNYFEIDNASGVAESDKVIDDGSITFYLWVALN